MEKLIINPRTKVLQLIETYPELEEVLISEVPAFSKLKNPVLRKTVARITNLQQAAIVGQIEVDYLINLLRKHVDQEVFHTESGGHKISMEKPDWVEGAQLFKSLNTKPMLEAGEHPIAIVIEDLKRLPDDQVYMVEAPFIPAPLIEKASSIGFAYWVEKKDENSWNIWFKKTG